MTDGSDRPPAPAGDDLAERIGAASRRHELEDPDRGLPLADRVINRAVELLGVGLLGGILAIVFASALARYALDYSFVWAEEVVISLVPWLALTGLFLSVRPRQMIRIEFFLDQFPPPARSALAAMAELLAAAMLAWLGFNYVATFGAAPARLWPQLDGRAPRGLPGDRDQLEEGPPGATARDARQAAGGRAGGPSCLGAAPHFRAPATSTSRSSATSPSSTAYRWRTKCDRNYRTRRRRAGLRSLNGPARRSSKTARGATRGHTLTKALWGRFGAPFMCHHCDMEVPRLPGNRWKSLSLPVVTWRHTIEAFSG